MKPNFALSLSFEGIRLLHRAAGGWRLVGDVALDAADMGDALVALRRQAEALAPEGVRCKLLIPNEQIKYLTIETEDTFEEARDTAVRKALAGATPYMVSDLAYDFCVDGAATHVAAVAKETLAEAESFALEHLFYPVSFAAVPDDQPYLGEPFFGPTKAAAKILPNGEEVEPDGIAVVVIGKMPAPEADQALKKPAAAKETSKAAPPVPPKKPEAEVQAEQEEVAPAPPQPDKVAAASPVIEEPSEQPTKPEGSEAAKDLVPELPPLRSAAAKPKAAKVAPAPKAPSLGFASRRAEAAPPAVKAPVLSAPVKTVPEPPVTAGKLVVDDPAPLPEPQTGLENKSFLSRRKSAVAALTKALPQRSAAKAVAAPAPKADPSEKERMTVFGAREVEVGGKPRFLGLILTTALLVFLAGVAAWASVFLDDGLGLSRLFGDREVQTTADMLDEDPASNAAPQVRLVALDPQLSDADDAVLEALSTPAPEGDDVLSDAELAELYAVSGIWPLAPDVPPDPAGLVNIDDLYLTSIDPISTANDAVALPAVRAFDTDVVLAAVGNPAAAGTQFALDSRGMVIPTVQGALSPDGITVYLGRPPLVPPATPTRFQSAPEDTTPRSALGAFRPRAKPENLAERRERAQFGGITFSELAALRPALRPQSLQEQAVAALNTDDAVAAALATPEGIASASTFAAAASLRPDTRPNNFGAIVQRAERNRAEEETVQVASAAAVAPRAVVPNIPTKASVSRQATVKNAINLRKVNLIGVYGKPSQRRALVRLSNGRYKKVVVGDRIDGGRVSAIGNSELRYVKGGRNVVLKMPR